MQVDDFLKKPDWTRDVTESIVHEWDELGTQLRDAFLNKFGIHQDEFDNFNSYLPEIIKLVKEHVKIMYVDPVKDELHQIFVTECHFVKPYDRCYGLDDPEQSLLRGNYEGVIRATMMYTIHRQTESQVAEPEKLSNLEEANLSESDDDEGMNIADEDEEEINEEINIDDYKEEDDTQVFGFQPDKYLAYNVCLHQCVVENHLLLEMPVLLGSGLCNMSSSFHLPSVFSKLYFRMPTYCVSRTFKLCPYEEYYQNNRLLTFKAEEVQIRCRFVHQSKKFRTNSTIKVTLATAKFRPKSFWEQPPRFMVEIPHEKPKQFIPLTVLAMAFGWTPTKFVDAVRYYVRQTTATRELEMFLHILAVDNENCQTQRDALLRASKCFAKCKVPVATEILEVVGDAAPKPKASVLLKEADILSYASYNLHGEFLAHLMEDSTMYDRENFRKGDALAQAAAELICQSPLINKTKPEIKLHDNRAYNIKCIASPGAELVILVRKYLKTFAQKASSKLKKLVTDGKRIDLNNVFNRKLVQLTRSIKNGVWDSKTDASESNQNKTQMMITGFCNDANHMQTQKIIKFAVKKNNNPETLLTHPTQSGRIDPYLTPESDKCGIVRFKTLGCCISPLVDLVAISKIVTRCILSQAERLKWIPFESHMYPASSTVYSVYDVYGGLIGFVEDAVHLYNYFRNLRRKGVLYRYFGMELDPVRFKFFFNCDEGRMVRPLIIAENIPKFYQVLQSSFFRDLLDPLPFLVSQSLIEYLDACEEYSGMVLVADTLQTAFHAPITYTHVEVHGCFSLCMGTAKAFANHNQGPRRLQTGNLEKRSIGLKLYPDRGTTDSHTLWYGEEDLISDPVDEVLHMRQEEPNGVMLWGAILAEDNMEDCWAINKGTVEMGACISSKYHVITTSLTGNCIFGKPEANCKGRASDDKYRNLDPNGFAIPGSTMNYGDAVVGKMTEYKDVAEPGKSKKPKDMKLLRCVSKFIPWYAQYRVVSVDLLPPDNPKTARTTLIQINVPMVGNKYYLKHGQKGTCGVMVAKEDMPYISTGPNAGIILDFTVGACSVMRVTQGLFGEMMFGKARAMSPSLIMQYDTLFVAQKTFRNKLRVVQHVLSGHGLNYMATDMICCGITGAPMRTLIFNGPAKFGVLKHMAQDKLHGRDRGPTIDLTRQAPAGLLTNGAQKFGEMENWDLHSWGLAELFRNMNYFVADKFKILFCTRCKIPAIGCEANKFFFCTNCKKFDEIVCIPIPYITNLTQQETFAAGFGHCLVVKKADPKTNVFAASKHF